jgi:hypothetical protein
MFISEKGKWNHVWTETRWKLGVEIQPNEVICGDQTDL